MRKKTEVDFNTTTIYRGGCFTFMIDLVMIIRISMFTEF